MAVKKKTLKTVRVALCGNPNVGKSTLFNLLTGKHRHTGNWSGKTVDTAAATVAYNGVSYVFYDVPGTYSLVTHSREEEIAADFLFSVKADVYLYVCDAGTVERSLPLFFQIREAVGEIVICPNLLKEASRHNIELDTELLSSLTDSPTLRLDARDKKARERLFEFLSTYQRKKDFLKVVKYPAEIESSINTLSDRLSAFTYGGVSSYFLAMRLLLGDFDTVRPLLSTDESDFANLCLCSLEEERRLFDLGYTRERISDEIAIALAKKAQSVGKQVTKRKNDGARYGNGTLDKIICGKFTAYPIMALFLALCFFITLHLASYPSEWLDTLFSRVNIKITASLLELGVRRGTVMAISEGILGTLFTVISVMLPPMAIFFPMFSLLEESGFLPRIAYNLDKPFASSGACGKQALTMCMGLGCNAVGVSGARIIDSERERLLAIITNSFVPCNGRFPILASIGAVFSALAFGCGDSFYSALFVTAFVVFGICMTFPVTLLLSRTVLRGERSSFTLEMPPFRKPQILRVIFVSLKTKVLSVLMRAVAVAAPMGLILYLLSNIFINGESLMGIAAHALDPLALLIGIDGVILLSFILALPASEMVIPIMISIYAMSSGAGSLSLLDLLTQNGFTSVRAICMCVFCLFHFPCSTTLITVYKETKSVKYTALAALVPTLIGTVLCFCINILARFLL